jgi:hypothetical protein
VSTAAAQSRRNGVDTARLFATLDGVKAQPEAARFRFSVENRWISGTHNSLGQIRVSFRVCGDAAPAEHRALVEQAMAWSAVYDVLTRGVPVTVDVTPTPEAIRKTAIGNELPIDQITQVRVLNPYFYA